MIRLTTPQGGVVYLAPTAIAQVSKAGASQAWHGIRANVQTFGGEWLEVQESPEEVVKLLDEETRQ